MLRANRYIWYTSFGLVIRLCCGLQKLVGSEKGGKPPNKAEGAES